MQNPPRTSASPRCSTARVARQHLLVGMAHMFWRVSAKPTGISAVVSLSPSCSRRCSFLTTIDAGTRVGDSYFRTSWVRCGDRSGIRVRGPRTLRQCFAGRSNGAGSCIKASSILLAESTHFGRCLALPISCCRYRALSWHDAFDQMHKAKYIFVTLVR